MRTENIIRGLRRFRYRKKYRGLQTEALGNSFLNPAGLSCSSVKTGKQAVRLSDMGLGFLILDLSSQEIRQAVSQVDGRNRNTLLGAEISKDFCRNFSLFYDFADFFVISPDNMEGLQSPEVPDICDILDELISLRLCDEHYKPILLRLSPGFTPDEIRSILDFSQLSGIDGIAVSGAAKVRFVSEYTKGRFPVLGSAVGCSPAEARKLFEEGASLVETGPGLRSARKLLNTLVKQPLNA